MSAAVVIGVLALGLAILFAWAFRHLPRERWQVLASFPRERQPDGAWRGVNLTYYGVFSALGVGIAVALALFLLGTVGLPLAYLAGCAVAFLAVVLSASELLNRLVEGTGTDSPSGAVALPGWWRARG